MAGVGEGADWWPTLIDLLPSEGEQHEVLLFGSI